MALSRLNVLLFAMSALHVGTEAQSCDRTIQGPIVLPVKNVSVEDGKIRRGMQFQYGTSIQNIATAVSQGWNETYIYDESGQCSEIATDACTMIRGGAFDQGSSSTWSSYSSISNLNSQDNVTVNTGLGGRAGTDLLTINSTLSFKNFPVAIPRIAGPDYSAFGLGRGSRILDIARNAGAIASKSYSVFWGQTGIKSSNAHDGAVVLGGIDQTQTTGTNFTDTIRYSASCRSGMVIPVTDMRISLPTGSGGSLMSSSARGQPVYYCLETEFPMITMLSAQWSQWESLDRNVYSTGNSNVRAGAYPNLWGLLYPTANITEANLTITIGNGLSITIPNHQLVQAYYTFDNNGATTVNDTVRELMINPLQGGNANDMPKFGMTFFQAAYLHVNYDQNQFVLWQAANPTGPGKYAGVGSSTVGCGTAGLGNDTSTGNNSTSPNNDSNNNTGRGSLSGGTIGGIVAGSVVGILAFAGLVFFLYRRRKHYNRPPSEAATPLYAYGGGVEKPELAGLYYDGGHQHQYHGGGKAEMGSSTGGAGSTTPSWMQGQQQPRQEVPAIEMHRPTLEPQEMPSERYD